MRKWIAILLISLLTASPCFADWTGQADKRWRSPVTTIGDLPTIGNNDGDVRFVTAAAAVYGWTGSAWACVGSAVDQLVKVTASDTTADYLDAKIVGASAISTAVSGGIGLETLRVSVKYDNVGIGLNGSNQLYVLDDGIHATKLNNDVGGVAIERDAGTKALNARYDNASIGVNLTNQLYVKDDGITEPMLAMNNSPTTNYFIRWNGSSMEWVDIGTVATIWNVVENVSQTMHGFALGDVVRWDTGTSKFIKAQADSASNAEVVGIVGNIIDLDTFGLVMSGKVDSLTGLVAGNVYFLDDVTPGLLTATAPTAVGHINKPLLIAIDATTGYFYNWRGIEIGSPIAPAGGVSYLTVNDESGTLTDARQITNGTGIGISDGGAGSTFTVSVTATLEDITTNGGTTDQVCQFTNPVGNILGAFGTPNIAGVLGFISAGTNAYYTGFQTGSQSEAILYTLPLNYPTSNDLPLIVSTAGVMSWNDQPVMTGSDVEFNSVSSPDIEPLGGDNTGKIGDTGSRWANIYCTNIYTGDIKMLNDWVIKEDWNGPNGIILISPSGKKYKFVVEEYHD